MRKWIILTLLGLGVSVQAIPIKKLDGNTSPESLKETLRALRVSKFEGLRWLRENGEPSFQGLQVIALDEKKWSTELRWRAVIRMAQVWPQKSETFLAKALENRDWLLRNASLKAASYVRKERARDWAERSLSDPAMLVRTQAADLLGQVGDQGSKELLWKELQKRRNFRGRQSLWVRNHILKALAKLSTEEEAGRFIPYLDESEERIQRSTVEALELLMGQRAHRPTHHKMPLGLRVRQWQSWWREHQLKKI